MSTAPGNLVFNTRRPLQEQPFNTSNTVDANSKITETPVNRKSVTKLTTPPESTLSRKRGISFETPIKNTTDPDTKLDTNIDSALLSPAFSSPRNTKSYRTASSPPPACINPSSSLSLPDDFKPTLTVPNPTPAVTKKKKSKKESKEAAFDLDSEEKPPYSYATLIGISILSHEDKRLPLSQIYQWISDTFKYYKREDVGWQNSIRHNLSLNKAFVKGEKSKDGKGHFWCIKPGFEEQFLKSRSVKKSSYHEVMDQINSANLNKLKNKEETKRSMNAIPSSPNSGEIKTFKAPPNYHYNSTKTNKKKRSYKYSDDESSDDYSYDYTKADEDEAENTHENTDGLKKQRTDKLGAPFGPWPEDSQLNLNTPQFIITESPIKPLLAGKNLTYTSSFSCNSNLELSPIRPSETGPLLEPITPANNAYQNPPQHIHNHSILHHHLLQRPSSTSSSSVLNHPLNTTSTTPNILQRTPKSNVIRTPLRNLRTPQTNSIMKRLWNSPSYLDEFYYSPLVSSHSLLQHQTSMNGLLNSYDDDDMIMRNFENHPHHHQSPVLSKKSGSTASLTSTVADSSRNLFNDLKNVSDSSVSSDEPETAKTAHSRQVSSSSTEADEN